MCIYKSGLQNVNSLQNVYYLESAILESNYLILRQLFQQFRFIHILQTYFNFHMEKSCIIYVISHAQISASHTKTKS
jgi:hypothetical protein